MTEAERLLLARVADLQHIADPADHFGLFFFAALFEKTLKHGSVVEMIFNGVLAFSGDDNNVFDPGSDAFFRDVLNLRLVHDREHFFRLGLGGGEKTRSEAGGREDGFSDLLHQGTIPW